jgi:hypothetical protein
MIPSVRQRYNQKFTEENYQNLLAALTREAGLAIKFRVAETPIFIPEYFKDELLTASREIIQFIKSPDFKKITDRSIPQAHFVPHETQHTNFLALDFAIVKGTDAKYVPQLIEMQGFPSLFGFQDALANQFRQQFDIPKDYFNHFGMASEAYRQRLRSMLLGSHDPENVILLEIDPLEQNTAVDFIYTQQFTGIRPVHLGDVRRAGKALSYIHEGRRIPIHRIYNRVIFDELEKRTDLQMEFHLTEEVDVEWAGHPNWFYRISKFAMPFIRSVYVPECRFVSDYNEVPRDIENYVLKPLFSFSGTGIIFNATRNDLDSIPVAERPNYLLQRKVQYAPVIVSPDGNVKAEIRLLFFWGDDEPEPVLVTNLARLSRGEMIGVKFNKDKTWVGGTVCFFEP